MNKEHSAVMFNSWGHQFRFFHRSSINNAIYVPNTSKDNIDNTIDNMVEMYWRPLVSLSQQSKTHWQLIYDAGDHGNAW